jgi:hypothetical protein
VKLYTYTMERSLPRMALKGMPEGFPLYGVPLPAAEEVATQNISNPKDRAVVLEVNADGLDSILVVSGERVEDVASMAQDDIEGDPDRPEGRVTEEQAIKAYEEVYSWTENLGSVAEALEKFDVVENQDVIPASRITVLGFGKVEYPDDIEGEGKVVFEAAPKPLKSFGQPFVTRLLRSIFLPKPKLYGAGKRGPAMGFISRFLPKREEVDVDEPPPDVVGGVSLVWAAGKTFRRGMRGAFGDEPRDAIGQMITMRAGQEPGKYLGSGAKGAVYVLGRGRVLKVTMDGNEIYAAANLIGVQHPNLSLVHDVFVVTDGVKGVGVIVRDAVDTTLDKFDPKTSVLLDQIMDEVLESSVDKIGVEITRIEDVDPEVLANEVELAIKLLREEGCEVDEQALLDVADAFRELRHLGILGIDFDSKNIGIIKKPTPRTVIFDYGMTKSPPVEVEVVSLERVRA